MSRPTAREIAELTARLRQLSTPGRPVDSDERAVFLDDKHALLDRIAAVERVSEAATNRDAVDRLVSLGYDRVRAEAMVADFVDDQHDMDAPARGDRVGGVVEYEPESARREQLARWHSDDEASGSTDAQEWTSDADGR